MRKQQDVEGDGRPTPTAPTPVSATRSAVERVPSDQLWRDAILATRRAAVSVAELRRAMGGGQGVASKG